MELLIFSDQTDGVQKKIIPNTLQLQFFYKCLILLAIPQFFSFPLEPLNP